MMYPSLVNPYMASATPGAQSMSVMPGASGNLMVAADASVTPSSAGFGGQPAKWWFGFAVFLLVLKIAAERKESRLSPAHYHIGAYNIAALLLAWAVVWTGTKVMVNRFLPQSDLATYVNWL